MGILRGILDRIVLLAALLIAACVPSFVVQYRQRLGGRLDQVRIDLAPFQAIADRNFGGSLSKLVDHHLASPDSTFHQEGMAIQAMVDSAARLTEAVQALNTDLIHQCLYLLRHSDHSLVQATWSVYQPGFTLTLPGALFALGFGLIVWLLFLGFWHGSVAAVRASGRRARGGGNHRGHPPRAGTH
ncbi:MAG: DUF2937 family protein [Steroidobacteraceae bacterium]